jgi:plastocyanin
MRLRVKFAHLVVAAALTGCATGITVGLALADDKAAAVKIDNFTFTPQTLTVNAGTTVTWINEDDIPHTVTSSTKQFKSRAMDTDDKFSFTFTTPGTYQYFCSLHPHMTGTIVVAAQAGAGDGAP